MEQEGFVPKPVGPMFGMSLIDCRNDRPAAYMVLSGFKQINRLPETGIHLFQVAWFAFVNGDGCEKRFLILGKAGVGKGWDVYILCKTAFVFLLKWRFSDWGLLRTVRILMCLSAILATLKNPQTGCHAKTESVSNTGILYKLGYLKREQCFQVA